jgi:hypothetical protein
MISEHILLFVPQISFSANLIIKPFKILFCESVIGKEFSDLIVDVLFGFISIFKLEFVNEHSFELFSFLNAQ